jgi:hypothetical protein
MPAPGEGKKDFDAERFKNFVAHFDNGNQNERSNAVRQALKMCDECELRFSDAVEQAFQLGDTELHGKVTDLENALRQATQYGNDLEAELNKALALNEELQNQLDQKDNDDDGKRGWSFRGWSDPATLPCLVLSGIIAANWLFWLVLLAYNFEGSRTLITIIDVVLYSELAALIWWSVVVARTAGMKTLWVKWAVLVMGWLLALLLISVFQSYSYPFKSSEIVSAALPFSWWKPFLFPVYEMRWFCPSCTIVKNTLPETIIGVGVLAGVVAVNLSGFSGWLLRVFHKVGEA